VPTAATCCPTPSPGVFIGRSYGTLRAAWPTVHSERRSGPVGVLCLQRLGYTIKVVLPRVPWRRW
jgi:hypothetical protein